MAQLASNPNDSKHILSRANERTEFTCQQTRHGMVAEEKQKLRSKRGRQRPTAKNCNGIAFRGGRSAAVFDGEMLPAPDVRGATTVFIVSESPAVRVRHCSHPPLPSRWLKYKWHYTAGKPSLCSPSLSIALALSFFFFSFFWL